MKPLTFLGDSRERLRAFPDAAREATGRQLLRVQLGGDPLDWKPLAAVGPGVREVRVRTEAGAFRTVYLAALADRVLVLHAFQKKTRATPKRDIELAAKRLRAWRAGHGG